MSPGLTANYHNLANISASCCCANHVFKLKARHGLKNGLESQSDACSKALLQMDCSNATEQTSPLRRLKAQ